MIEPHTSIISTISTLIELAVAPVFLLAGVAGLLNVFIGRLTRIIDKLERIDSLEIPENEFNKKDFFTKRRAFLVMRMQNTNLAIFFCTATGLMVSLVIITIFFTAILSFNAQTLISMLFVLAMFSLIVSLLLFLREIYFTTSYIKEKKEDHSFNLNK